MCGFLCKGASEYATATVYNVCEQLLANWPTKQGTFKRAFVVLVQICVPSTLIVILLRHCCAGPSLWPCLSSRPVVLPTFQHLFLICIINYNDEVPTMCCHNDDWLLWLRVRFLFTFCSLAPHPSSPLSLHRLQTHGCNRIPYHADYCLLFPDRSQAAPGAARGVASSNGREQEGEAYPEQKRKLFVDSVIYSYWAWLEWQFIC